AYMGRPQEGEEMLAAIDTFDAGLMEVALVAMTRSDILFWGLGRYDDAVAVNLAAETAVEGTPLELEIACQRANYELQAGRPPVAVDIVKPALELESGRTFITAAIVGSPALALMGHTAGAISLAERGFAEHTRLRDEVVMFRPGNHQVALAVAQMEAGLLPAAEASAQAAYEQAVADGAGRDQAWAAMILGRAQLFIGRPRSARRRFTE